jgi:AraC family transcriptional regulator
LYSKKSNNGVVVASKIFYTIANGEGMHMAKKMSTQMSYQERINRLLIHVQENLDKPLYLDNLARVAALSKFHLHRIFHAHTHETLNRYVRRLKLEYAAGMILYSQKSISLIAMECGYDTPAAFNKAFLKYFGASPTNFRKVTHAPCNTQHTKNNKGKTMNITPTITTIKPIRVIFLRGLGSYTMTPKEVWPKLEQYARQKGLVKNDTRRFGISHDDPIITPEEKLRYDACIEVDEHATADNEFGIQTIAGGKYATFTHHGTCRNLDKLYDYIYKIWLPSSSHTLRSAPCFEEYIDRGSWIQGKITTEELISTVNVPIE